MGGLDDSLTEPAPRPLCLRSGKVCGCFFHCACTWIRLSGASIPPPPPALPFLQVRFLTRGFTNPGDHTGQSTSGYRWPYGPVAIITPFNFPMEIPALQLMGALYMGNKPLLHVDQRVRVLHPCMHGAHSLIHRRLVDVGHL